LIRTWGQMIAMPQVCGFYGKYCNECCLYKDVFPGKASSLQPRKILPPSHKNHLRLHTTNTKLATPASLLTPPDAVCELRTYSNYSNTFTSVFKAPIFIHNILNLIFQYENWEILSLSTCHEGTSGEVSMYSSTGRV